MKEMKMKSKQELGRENARSTTTSGKNAKRQYNTAGFRIVNNQY